MKPIIVFPDPRAAVCDLLRAELERLGVKATVSVRDIPGNHRTGWPRPYIQVKSDGAFRNAALDGRASIRVLVYGTDSGDSEQLAALCEGIMLARTNDRIRSCSSVMSVRPTTDVDNNLPFSYFTATVRLRPHQIEDRS